MKAYVLEKGSQSLESLKCIERAKPEPSPSEIIVRMRAASLNYRDQLVVTGRYFGGVLQRDTIPLSDGSGEVVAAGAGVTRFKPGDRIAGTFFRGWIDGPPTPGPRVALGSPADGVLAEYVAFDQNDAVHIPGNLTFEEAATLPCAGVTAWNALMVSGKVKPGDKVLVMGTGGVSIFALQFARAAGAHVIITSSSDEKLERAKALGAAEGINYRRIPEWGKEVQKLTGGLGVHHVVEVGGAGTLAQSMQAVGLAGKIALIGVLTGFQGDTNPHPIMLKGAGMQGIFVGNRSMFESMNAAIEVNRIKPVIDKVFPFEQAADAYRHLQSGAHFGKIVIAI